MITFALMKLFYTPDITSDKTYTLSESESKHAIKVLRLSINDEITLVDGTGTFYNAKISSDNPKRCEVEILNTSKEENVNPKIHIAIAPTKNNDRLEWFTEKATEIGVSTITPLICENSERKVLKIERIEKRAIAAMKQSLKATLPQINDIEKFSSFIEKRFDRNKYIAHCYEQQQSLLKDCYEKGENALILIGPEGDFSEEEVKLAIDKGFVPVSFGNSRLRTETAGIVACHTLNLLNE